MRICIGACAYIASICAITELRKTKVIIIERKRKLVAEFAKSRVPRVLVAFYSSNLEWMGKGKMIESEAALKQF